LTTSGGLSLLISVRFSIAVILLVALVAGCAHHKPSQSTTRSTSDTAFTELAPPAASGGSQTAPKATLNPAALTTPELPKNQKLIVTPETGLSGKVVSFNPVGRFVVLNFPVGHLPVQDQQLIVYRLGLKVGEVKVTNLRNDDYLVADMVTGEAAAGDQVRDR
jgi:hypothetical protein